MKSQTSNKGAAAAGSSMDVALRVLGVRDHSCFEMEQKLLSRGFDEAEVQAAAEKLVDYLRSYPVDGEGNLAYRQREKNRIFADGLGMKLKLEFVKG